MSEQYKRPSVEQYATQLESGAQIESHKSELMSVEEVRARELADKLAVPNVPEKVQPSEQEKAAIAGRYVMYLRKSELDLAA